VAILESRYASAHRKTQFHPQTIDRPHHFRNNKKND
jgi:hypothetical protein